MNHVTIGIGIALLCVAVYGIYVRAATPDKVKKLAGLQRLFGNSGGNIVYVISYILLPLICGVLFIYFGVNGQGIFGG